MDAVKNNVLEKNKKYSRHPTSRWNKLYLKEGIKI